MEDDGVQHDVFVGAARIIDVWCLDGDTSGKGYRGSGAEERLDNGWATCVVVGDQRVEGRGCSNSNLKKPLRGAAQPVAESCGEPTSAQGWGSLEAQEGGPQHQGRLRRKTRTREFPERQGQWELGYGLEQVLSVH